MASHLGLIHRSTRSALRSWANLPSLNTGIYRLRYLSDKNKGSRPQDGIPEGVEFEEVIDSKQFQVDASLFTVEVEVKMPVMGEVEGKVLKWYKEEGDVLQREEILCDIEMPDFTFGMEIDDEEIGIVGKIFVEEGSDYVKENEVICTILHMPPLEKEAKKERSKEDKKTEP